MMTINLAEAFAGLNRLAALDMQPWLQMVGKQQKAVIQERIEHTKVDPDDQAWAPWKPYTRAVRSAKGNADQGLLWDTSALLHSIRDVESFHEVEIGTDIAYAQELQEGRPNMKARPFIGWGEDSVSLEASAIAYIESLFR